MRQHIPRILVLVVIAVIALFYITTFVVHEAEGALLVTFGRPARVLAGPKDAGLWFRWPWPIQKVYHYDMRSRLYNSELQEVATSDGQLLVAGTFLLWRVTKPQAFHEAVAGDMSRARDVIASPLRSSVSNVVAAHRYSSLVEHEPSALREELPKGGGVLETMEDNIRKAVSRQVEPYGIEVTQVGFYQLVLPEKVAKGVFEQIRQAKEGEAERLRSEGKAMARKIRAEANRDYEETLAGARTKASEITAEARAEAARLLSEIKDKDLLTFLDKLDTLEEMFSGDSTIVWDFKHAPLDLLSGIFNKKASGEKSASGRLEDDPGNGEGANEPPGED